MKKKSEPVNEMKYVLHEAIELIRNYDIVIEKDGVKILTDNIAESREIKKSLIVLLYPPNVHFRSWEENQYRKWMKSMFNDIDNEEIF